MNETERAGASPELLAYVAETEAAMASLVRVLNLEPVSGRPGGLATWDDIVAYTAKTRDGHVLANRNTRRRETELRQALGLPDDVRWPALIAAVRALRGGAAVVLDLPPRSDR